MAANTFRESVRERVLYSLVLFAVLMTLSGLLLRRLAVHQDEKIIKDLGLACIELFGTLIALYLGVGLISKEIERRSLYPLLARPLGRDEFLLGKFAGLGFTLCVNVALMTAGLYLTLLATGRGADPRLLIAVYMTFLGVLLVVALAMLFSSLMSSTVMAAATTFSVVMAGRYADVIRNARQVAPDVPAWLTEGLYLLLPNFRNFDVKNRVVYGDPVDLAVVGWSTSYACVYIALALSVAAGSFRSRELQ